MKKLNKRQSSKSITTAVRKRANYQWRLSRRLKALFDYFRKARNRLEKVHLPPLVAKVEPEQLQYLFLDSIILACSYIDALAAFRYGQSHNGFIHFLQAYSGPKQQSWYRRISCLYLDQPPLTANGEPRVPAATLSKIRHALYGNAAPKATTDLPLSAAFQRLVSASISTPLDKLNQFSYAAYFYERYRCHGVHNVQPSISGIILNTEPHYELRRMPKQLIFPKGFILDTLSTCTDNFEREVLGKLGSKTISKTANDYRWLKETYNLKGSFIETVLAYRRPGP